MSLDHFKSSKFHFELGRELAALRRKGVLIIGSGNIVHNLRMVAWNKLQEDEYGYDWAQEANENMKQFILNENYDALINYHVQGTSFDLAIPTPEHYLPLLYILALKEKQEAISIFNDKLIGGSLSMASVKID